MKKLLVSRAICLLTCFMLLPTTGLAKDDRKESMRKTFCMNLEELEKLTSDHGEIPIARGVNAYPDISSLVIFINPDNQTFTVVERITADNYCVLALGGRFEAVPESIQKNNQQRQEKRKL